MASRLIDDIFRSMFGKPEIFPHLRNSMTFKYRNDDIEIILNYNVNIPRNLKKFKPFPYSLRPDFVISRRSRYRRNKIVFIADAKYKEATDSSDIQQMLAYILTSGWLDVSDRVQGSILFIGSRNRVIATREFSRRNPTAKLNLINIRPSSTYDELTRIIKSLISEIH